MGDFSIRKLPDFVRRHRIKEAVLPGLNEILRCKFQREKKIRWLDSQCFFLSQRGTERKKNQFSVLLEHDKCPRRERESYISPSALQIHERARTVKLKANAVPLRRRFFPSSSQPQYFSPLIRAVCITKCEWEEKSSYCLPEKLLLSIELRWTQNTTTHQSVSVRFGYIEQTTPAI